MSRNIDTKSHYFVLMRPLHLTPFEFLGYTSSLDDLVWVECKVVEELYKVSEGYKIELRAIEEGYGKETYYQEDFKSLMEEGCIIKKESEHEHVEDIVLVEPITELAYVRRPISVIMEGDIK